LNDVPQRKQDSTNTPLLQKWIRFLPFIKTGSVVFVTLAGYMAGVIYYSSYLQAFQIDDRTFPVDTFRYWVYGAFAMYQLCLSVISGANSHFRVTVLFALAVIGYVMLTQAAFYSSSDRAANRRIKATQKIRALWNSHQRLKSAAQAGLVAIAAIWSAGVLVFFIASLIGIPIVIGQEGARASYIDASKGYAGGCEHPENGSLCSRLYDQDKLIAEGFVIAASPEQVALYKDGTTTILDLKARKLVTGGIATPLKSPAKK
jgi:hypothetical protein